jgi:hypothetical protein
VEWVDPAGALRGVRRGRARGRSVEDAVEGGVVFAVEAVDAELWMQRSGCSAVDAVDAAQWMLPPAAAPAALLRPRAPGLCSG